MPEVKKQKIVKRLATVPAMKRFYGLKLKETAAVYQRV
jgi:hypothetical protein